MLKNYVLSAFRSLLRNKVSSLINIVGLSIAVAAAIVVYLFVRVYYTLDTFHAHGDRIFLVEQVTTRTGEARTWGSVPAPLGPALAADLPQVERAVRMDYGFANVRTEGATFEERITFVDDGFFDVFTFPLSAGAPPAPGQIVLSEETARRYFGAEDPLGRSLVLSFGEAAGKTYLVRGVAASFPNNTGFRFELLLPFDERPDARVDDWSQTTALFLLLSRPEDIDAVAEQMGRYVDRAIAANPEAPIDRFVFENLVDPSPQAYNVIQRATEAPHPAFTILMGTLAALMMALACFNYINIALGNAARRIKEIGVRKTIGGTQQQLVVQFMAENLLVCTLAMVLGFAIAAFGLIPFFNDLFVLKIGLVNAGGVAFWVFLAGLLALVGVISGAYPAFYVASFKPTLIFQGKAQLANKRWLTRSLLTAQFVIAFLAVIVTVVLVQNGEYLRRQAWGYDNAGLVIVRLSDPAQFDPMFDAAVGLAGVRRVAGAPDHVGVAMYRVTYTLGREEEYSALALRAGPGYAETMGLRLLEGRFFDERITSDADAAILVNEAFVKERGWGDPVGRTVRMEGAEHMIIGVVGNFLNTPVSRPGPVMLRAPALPPRFMAVRTQPDQEKATLNGLEAAWKERFPGIPFDAFNQVDVFDTQIAAYKNLANGIGYLAGLALLIACMGVFGLAAQNVSRRMKEVSIRKALGASVTQIVMLVNRLFLVILAIAAGIATAVSVGAVQTLLSLDVANFLPLSPWPFLLAYVTVVLSVAISVAAQSRTLALANPADSLRRE